jgi:hypothetical protein
MEFSLFVSCIEGKPVTRFGSRTFIGAEREGDSNVIHWFPDRVIAIPASEHDRFRKEYDRVLRDGDLRVRTKSDWLQQTEAEDAATKRGEADKRSAADKRQADEKRGAAEAAAPSKE